MAMNHYGYQKTLSSFEELAKHLEDMTRHREQLEGDGSWQQVSRGHYIQHSVLLFVVYLYALRVPSELALSVPSTK